MVKFVALLGHDDRMKDLPERVRVRVHIYNRKAISWEPSGLNIKVYARFSTSAFIRILGDG